MLDLQQLLLEASDLTPGIRVQLSCHLQGLNALLESMPLVFVPFIVLWGQRVAQLQTFSLPTIEVYHCEHIKHAVCLFVVSLEHFGPIGL